MMIDREKVIKGMECCIAGNCDECEYEKDGCLDNLNTFMSGLKRDALALLKAQEPKRVSVINNGFAGLPVTHCPKCHKQIDMFFGTQGVSTNFCPWCGQAVKWE